MKNSSDFSGPGASRYSTGPEHGRCTPPSPPGPQSVRSWPFAGGLTSPPAGRVMRPAVAAVALRVPAADARRDVVAARRGRRVGIRPPRGPAGVGPPARGRRVAALHLLLRARGAACGARRPLGLDAGGGVHPPERPAAGLAAFYVTASRLHWTWCAIVFAGPILWWLDKPHTEPFTFALYAVAFALFASAPWWSLVAVGAAATQNPGNAALVGILAVAAAAGKTSLLKDRRFWTGRWPPARRWRRSIRSTTS